MNTQLVKIVHIMIMLNTVEKSQGRIYKIWPAFILGKQIHFTLSIMRIKISNQKGEKAQKRKRQGDNENCGHHHEPYECHHMYPHSAENVSGHSRMVTLFFRRAVIVLLLDKHFSFLPFMPLNTFLPSNQKSCSLLDAKVIG